MTAYKTVAELAGMPPAAKSVPLKSGCWLHYNGPGSTGFGVKRTAMLLPESAMLMVGPLGCSRSGTVVAEEYGFSHRMFYLYLDDRSVAVGSYLRQIPEAVRTIASLGEFKAVLICMTCLDAMLGTDLAGLAKKISRETGIAVTSTFMDPIVRDGSFGPMVQVRKAITDCMERTEPDEQSVNLLGTFAPLAADSELPTVLSKAGIRQVKTVAGCEHFEQLRAMGNSAGNLAVHPQSLPCAEALSIRLGQPYCPVLTAYEPSAISENYAKIGDFLHFSPDVSAFRDKANLALADFKKAFAGKRIAVGEAVAGNPFDIALTLLSAGVSVPFLFRDMILPSDRADLQKLAAVCPDLPVYSGVSESPDDLFRSLPATDMVLGLDAGYFAPDAVSVAWPFDRCQFGYSGLIHLLTLLRKADEKPLSHREQMQGSYLTV